MIKLMPKQLTFTMASDLNGRNTHTDIHPTETVVTNVKRKSNRKVPYTHTHNTYRTHIYIRVGMRFSH